MAYGFTYTLPTIAGSHTDFPVLLKTDDFPSAAIDGTTNALNNGGGNLVAYTSDAKSTQLPVEIVRFVSSGSADAEVWIKIGTAATSGTIYIEADSSQTSQPAVTATYGRNAVWSDYAAVLHLSESSGNGTAGEFVDSTGNGHSGELTTGSSISGVSTAHPWGGSWLNFNGTEAITLASSDSMLDGSNLILSAWANFDERSSGEGLFGNRSDSPDNNWIQLQSSARLFVKGATTEDTIDPTEFSGSTSLLAHAEFEKANRLEVFEDGVTLGSAATSIHSSNQAGITGASDYRIGTYFDDRSSRKIDGRVGEVRARASLLANNWKVTEYDNQSSSSAWGTVGTWADSGGGGTQSVTLDQITENETVFTSTVTAGATNVTAGLLSEQETLFGLALSTGISISVGLIDASEFLFQADVSVAGPSITTSQITESESLFDSSVVVGTSSITTSQITESESLFDSSGVVGTSSITTGQIDESESLFDSSVVVGTSSITTSQIDESESLFDSSGVAASTITTGQISENETLTDVTKLVAGAISAGQITENDSVFEPSIDSGVVSATTGQLTESESLFDSLASLGTASLTAGQITELEALFDSTPVLGTASFIVGQLTELEALFDSNPSTAATPVTVGQLAELESLFDSAVISGVTSLTVGQLTESDLIFTVSSSISGGSGFTTIVSESETLFLVANADPAAIPGKIVYATLSISRHISF
jgi:hypothetical protein